MNIIREVAQFGRAPGSGPGGREFKSRLPDHHLIMHIIDVHYLFHYVGYDVF